MAASLPNNVQATHPESLRSDEFAQTTLKKHSANEQPSEAADIGSRHPTGVGHAQSPHDTISESQEPPRSGRFNSESWERRECESVADRGTGRMMGRDERVVHSETSCVVLEEEDVCEGCGQNRADRRQLLKLEKEVRRLEERLKEKDKTIAKLWEENTRKTAELLEFQLQKLQRSISDKDSAIAMLELKQQLSSEDVYAQGLERLKGERGKLTQQLKGKVQERVDLFCKDSDKALDSLAKQFQGYNKEQVCEALRALELTCVKLKSYIDQLLAVVLESNPDLLEAMPRIQQSTGMKLELFRMASLQELFEELHEKEQNCQSLQNYAGLLLQRITEQSPDLLQSIGSHDDRYCELLMPEQ